MTQPAAASKSVLAVPLVLKLAGSSSPFSAAAVTVQVLVAPA